MNDILELNEKDKLEGIIYKITNIVDQKLYIGQTVSHRKNKGKYRPFGHIGRFNDHISEAVNNTKRKQCTYLNNSIRKHGKDNFTVELIETCELKNLDTREQHYINEYNSLFPNGYNLTKGGKTGNHVDVCNNEPLNEPKKRGRNFGYVHKESTRNKMSERLKIMSQSDVIKDRMKITMKSYYDDKKKKFLMTCDLDDDVTKHIKEIKKRDTDIVHQYVICIKNKTISFYGKDDILQEKYDRLL